MTVLQYAHTTWALCIVRAGQNRIYAPYIMVYLVIYLSKKSKHTVCIWLWPTLCMVHSAQKCAMTVLQIVLQHADVWTTLLQLWLRLWLQLWLTVVCCCDCTNSTYYKVYATTYQLNSPCSCFSMSEWIWRLMFVSTCRFTQSLTCGLLGWWLTTFSVGAFALMTGRIVEALPFRSSGNQLVPNAARNSNAARNLCVHA